jgi:hypothetical protein
MRSYPAATDPILQITAGAVVDSEATIPALRAVREHEYALRSMTSAPAIRRCNI